MTPTCDSAESIATLLPETDLNDERILEMLASPLYLQEREASADRSSLSFLQRKLSVNFISLPSTFGESCRSVRTQKEVESRITTFSQRRYFFGTRSISRRKWKLLQYFRFSFCEWMISWLQELVSRNFRFREKVVLYQRRQSTRNLNRVTFMNFNHKLIPIVWKRTM